MLPSRNRLRLDKDIKALFARGKGVFDVATGMKWRENGLSISRFAVVVGTKVSKSAVKRNRIRRKIQAVIQSKLPSIHPGVDVVIIVRPEVLKLTKDEIQKHVESVLRKIP